MHRCKRACKDSLPLPFWNGLPAAAEMPPVATASVLPCPRPLHPCRWVEQDPLAIWHSVQEAVQAAMQSATEHHGPLNVRAVGITNQREWAAGSTAAHAAAAWRDPPLLALLSTAPTQRPQPCMACNRCRAC